MTKKCNVCGCTARSGCKDYAGRPCDWDEMHPDVCTLCVDAAEAVAEWLVSVRKPNGRALMKLAKEIFANTPIPYVLVEK